MVRDCCYRIGEIGSGQQQQSRAVFRSGQATLSMCRAGQMCAAFSMFLGSTIGDLRPSSCRSCVRRDGGQLGSLPAALDQLQRLQKAQDGCCS
ncbi:hypothetical protein L6452_32667 [Arctium lappa]|uniref:Uncharacterized protein n=1 Tax=Arctium lappa TaxID=4217 RepID=A0ACB8Z5M6_ARCLA|nr:hypothetical protein L6452_32667 [Arctium lappa]